MVPVSTPRPQETSSFYCLSLGVLLSISKPGHHEEAEQPTETPVMSGPMFSGPWTQLSSQPIASPVREPSWKWSSSPQATMNNAAVNIYAQVFV